MFGLSTAMLDTGEPFGLPKGTVRGIIALAFTGLLIYLFGTGQAVPEALLGITTLTVGFYFGGRGGAPDAPAPVKEESVLPPALGDGE